MHRTTNLHDLNELALQVRNDVSKTYILESIGAYKAGSYRASIVATWIAISYDIIAKIREIADQGDGKAKTLIEDLNKYIKNSDIRKLQEFEGNLLDNAKDDFEFINPSEYNHLTRVKDDRNYSAHPAFVGENRLFEPSGELARTHIVHAIIYLLRHSPTQGKAAMELVIRDVKRATFPKEYRQVKKYMQTHYLAKAKPNLIKGLVAGFLGGVLSGKAAQDGTELNLTQVLQAIAELYPDLFTQQVDAKLNKLVNDLTDDKLWYVLALIASIPTIWHHLQDTMQQRLENFLNLQSNNVQDFLNRYALLQRINVPELQPLLEQFHLKVNIEVEKAIDTYTKVRSYQAAIDTGKDKILPLVNYFTAQNLDNLIDGILVNPHDQIVSATGSDQILEAIFDSTQALFEQCRATWAKLLERLQQEEPFGTYKSLLSKLRVALASSPQK